MFLWLLGCCLLLLCSFSSLLGFVQLFCAPAGEMVHLITNAAAAHAPHFSSSSLRLTGSSVQAGTTRHHPHESSLPALRQTNQPIRSQRTEENARTKDSKLLYLELIITAIKND